MPAIRGKASKTCTHVLEYIPWYLFDGDEGDFFWDLQTRANFEASTPGGHHAPVPENGVDQFELPDVADPGPWLTEWASAQLGHPVRLTSANQVFKKSRLARGRTEPIYYVSPR
jgi:hypothetical protein